MAQKTVKRAVAKAKKAPKHKINEVKQHARDFWWSILLRGIAATVFGLIVILCPGLSFVAFLYLAGAFLSATGTVSIISGLIAAAKQPKSEQWKHMTLLGVMAFLVGFLLLCFPIASSEIFMLGLAAALIAVGAIKILQAATTPTLAIFKTANLAVGLLALIFGVIFLVYPGGSITVFAVLLGVVALIGGVLTILAAMDMYRVAHKLMKKGKK